MNDNTVLDNGVYVICASLAVLIILLCISVCCPRSGTEMYKRKLNNIGKWNDTKLSGTKPANILKTECKKQIMKKWSI